MEKLECTTAGSIELLLGFGCTVANSPESGASIILGMGIPVVPPGSSLVFPLLGGSRQMSVISAGGPASIDGIMRGTTVRNLSAWPVTINGQLCQPGAIFVL